MIERVFEGMLLKYERNFGLRRAKISFYRKEQSLRRLQPRMVGLFRGPLLNCLLRFVESTFTHEVPGVTPAVMLNSLICGEIIIFRLHLIHQEGRRIESIARGINF